MCVIIHKPKGKLFPEKDIRAAHKRNGDGFGFMFYHPEEKRIVTHKGLYTEPDEIIEAFRALKDYEAAFHFRFKTHGEISAAQAHPFQVAERQAHGTEIYFMHNGVISDVKEEGKESDTMAFNRSILQPMLTEKPSLIRVAATSILINKFIGMNNKLLFMYGRGEVTIINKQAGDTYEDCWVSNKHSFQPPVEQYPFRAHNTARKLFIGESVKEGDKAYVWQKDNPDFFVEGVIKQINFTSAEIIFTGIDGKKEDAYFDKDTGESYRGGYAALPENLGVDEFGMQTVEELKESQTPTDQKKSSSRVTVLGPSTNETSSKATPSGPKTQTTDDEEESPFHEDAPLSKKKEQETASQTQEKRPPISLIVSYDGHQFNSKEYRYGGAFVEDSYQVYSHANTEVTVDDIYFMTPQDRFEFFKNNTVISFSIFEDLIEKIHLEDEEDRLNDLDDEVDDDEDTDEKQPQLLLEDKSNG